ncbi:moesin/ezrin/radixin 2, partial [Paragonimus heterotremus]
VSKQIRRVKKPYQFNFRAKYFPEDALTELIHEVTQRLFYLQVKEDILSGAISCPFETAILLASYACQAKFGDYDPVRMQPGFFKKERLLPQNIIDQSEQTWEQLEESVVRWYNEHRSMLRSDVMLEYLHIAQDLEMYGVTYFKITNKRGTPLLLGVDAFGLNVYAEDNRLNPKVGLPWSEVAKVSFRRRKFIIKPVDKSSRNLSFFSPTMKNNRILLSLCVGTHELYLRRRRQEPIEVQHMRAQANAERAAKLQEQ